MKKQNMKSGDLLALSLELNTLGVMHRIVHASTAKNAHVHVQAPGKYSSYTEAAAAFAAIGAIGEEVEPGTTSLQITGPSSPSAQVDPHSRYTHGILVALASARDITYHLQNAHWTVRSSSFAEHHKFFNDAYDLFWDLQDRLAEQLRAFDISVSIPNNPDKLRAFSLINIADIEAADLHGSYESRFIIHLSYYAVFLDKIIKLLKDLYKLSQHPEVNDPAGETLFGDMLKELTKQRWQVRAYNSVEEDAGAGSELHSQRTAKNDLEDVKKNAYRFGDKLDTSNEGTEEE